MLCSAHKPERYDANKLYKKDHPELMAKMARTQSARRIGLDPDIVEAYYQEHNGCCDICGEGISDGRFTRLSIDHDHETGKFRGMLCNSCNNGLGRFKDNPKLLRLAADYLDTNVAQ
jgi:hypothetical protein